MSSPIVLQAIDSPRRELEWRLFLAAKLYTQGISSIIGSKTEIELIHSISEDAIFFGRLNGVTGRSHADKKFLEKANQNRTSIFFLHDEGGFYFQNEYQDAVKKIYPEELFHLEVFKKIYFWGKAQRDVFVDPLYNHKCSIVGSPRFDLLKPKYGFLDRDSSVSTGDGYILICTRFGAINRVDDEPGTLSRRSFDIRVEGGASGKFTKEEILTTMFAAWEKIGYEFCSFVNAVSKLVMSNPEHSFVIRPHPAEKQYFYDEAFSHFANVTVTKEGDVRTWIRNSLVVIQSECTTGLEAAIAKKPVINFRPMKGDFSVAGVSDIGAIATSSDELAIIFDQAINDPDSIIGNQISSDIENYVANVNDLSAYDRIVSDIRDYCKLYGISSQIRTSRVIFSKSNTKLFFREVGRRLLRAIRRLRLRSIGDSKDFIYSSKEIYTMWERYTGSKKGITVAAGVIIIKSKTNSSNI